MARPPHNPQRRRSWWLCVFLPCTVRSLAPRTVDESRQRFAASFRSPSGKLTYVPELVLPDPTDATGLLLHSNSVQTLGKRLRACQAHAMLVQASIPTLKLLAQEQESARGAVPGPVPLICAYEAALKAATMDDVDFDDYNGDDDNSKSLEVRDVMARIAAAGAEGVLLTANGGRSLPRTDVVPTVEGGGGAANPLAFDVPFVEACRAALECGLQPIPELVLVGAEGSEEGQNSNVDALLTPWIDAVARVLGTDPVCVVVTMQPAPVVTEEVTTDAMPALLEYPRVSKELGRRCPVVGSVRSPAGDNRIGRATASLKAAGYTGAFLRNECVPMGSPGRTLDLEIVGQFWASCVDDLRSVKSKSFAFRSKNNLEKKAATVWSNYQSNVIESGALGDPNESYSVVDAAAGDYQGFA